jgi:hypothetical protein
LVLEEYLDGELGPKQANAVDKHLITCADCATELNQLRAELELFQRNSPDVEVSKGLWDSVQARLLVGETSLPKGRRTSVYDRFAGLFSAPRFSVPVTVGLVLMAVIATTLVVKFLPPSQIESSNVNGVNAPSIATQVEKSDVKIADGVEEKPAVISKLSEVSKLRKGNSATRSRSVRLPTDKSPEQLVREAEKKYLEAIRILARDIERQHPQLDQETRMKFEQALTSIDRTIGSTRKAVQEHPTDPRAVQYMLAAYARKVDVLREMANRGAF